MRRLMLPRLKHLRHSGKLLLHTRKGVGWRPEWVGWQHTGIRPHPKNGESLQRCVHDTILVSEIIHKLERPPLIAKEREPQAAQYSSLKLRSTRKCWDTAIFLHYRTLCSLLLCWFCAPRKDIGGKITENQEPHTPRANSSCVVVVGNPTLHMLCAVPHTLVVGLALPYCRLMVLCVHWWGAEGRLRVGQRNSSAACY